jgi:hypothetical protein
LKIEYKLVQEGSCSTIKINMEHHSKIRRKINNLLVLKMLVIILFAYGCAIEQKDYTLVSSQKLNVPSNKQGPQVSGMDCTYFFILPLGDIRDDERNAVDKAIESAGPEYNALLNPSIYSVIQYFAIGRICIKVEGIAINVKDVSLVHETGGNRYLLHSER